MSPPPRPLLDEVLPPTPVVVLECVDVPGMPPPVELQAAVTALAAKNNTRIVCTRVIGHLGRKKRAPA